MSGKDEILLWSTQHFISYFWGQGKVTCRYSKIKISHCWGNFAQAYLSELAIDRGWLRCCHNRLVLFIYWIGHNTQSCLVHRMLQGVEHTDPTEWSNSHLLHWRQIHIGCSTNSSKQCCTSSPPGGKGGHLIEKWYELLVQHTLDGSLGTSVTYFRIGNGSVVAMWYVPCPRVQALVLLWARLENVTSWSN